MEILKNNLKLILLLAFLGLLSLILDVRSSSAQTGS